MIDAGTPGFVPQGSPVAHEHVLRDAVSWRAVLAGGVGAAAFALILLMLGLGLGLSAISPWAGHGASSATFGIAAVIWVCVTQIMASGLGGYLAGRLRRRWVGVHNDETYFRDTAHGFLAWAVSTLVAAALLGSGVSDMIKGAANAGQQILSPLAARGDADAFLRMWPAGYLIDGMFRPAAGLMPDGSGTPPATGAMSATADARRVTARVMLNSLPSHAALSPDDTQYLARLVSTQTGIDTNAAQARVLATYDRLAQKRDQIETAARSAAEKARKAAITATLWLFVSLLMGAFAACVTATIGGRLRDI